MLVVRVQFNKLDKEYFFLPKFTDSDVKEVKVRDKVIVETDLGQDIGTITGKADIDKKDFDEIKPMLRLANEDDLKKIKYQERKYDNYLDICRNLVKKYKLEMKLVDVYESFDNARLTFYFISDTRVDFRDLVKEIIGIFHKKIRLQQIGVRDEAKISGDMGTCGLPLCCKNWLKTLGNVSSDFIKDQNLIHRGNDRLSGVCGRLKCCLRYEEEAYKYNLDRLPKIGDIIKTKAGKGKVIKVRPLTQILDLKIDDAIVQYPYTEGDIRNSCKKDCNCRSCVK